MKTWQKHDLQPEDVAVLFIFSPDLKAIAVVPNGNKGLSRSTQFRPIPYEDAMEMTIEAAQKNIIKSTDPKSKLGPRPAGYPETAKAFYFGEYEPVPSLA